MSAGRTIDVELPGGAGRVLDAARRRERGPVRVAQPRHPDRRRPGARGREPRLLAGGIGLEPARVAMGWQVHGAEMREWAEPPAAAAYADPGATLDHVDGHATGVRGLGLLVLVADCLPVALVGDGRVAMLHCGWRPLAAGIVEKALAHVRRARPPRRSGRASAAAATRWARRCWREFAALDGVADGRMLDLRRSCGASSRRRGGGDRGRRPVHELPRRPVLLPPPRQRRHRPPGRCRVADVRRTFTGLEARVCASNLERVRERIAAAGRDPSEVRDLRGDQVRAGGGAPGAGRGRHRAGGGEPRAGPGRQAGRIGRTRSSGTSSARCSRARCATWRRACG